MNFPLPRSKKHQQANHFSPETHFPIYQNLSTGLFTMSALTPMSLMANSRPKNCGAFLCNRQPCRFAMVPSQISYGLISTMRFAMPCRSQQVGKEVELLEDDGLVTTRTKKTINNNKVPTNKSWNTYYTCLICILLAMCL